MSRALQLESCGTSLSKEQRQCAGKGTAALVMAIPETNKQKNETKQTNKKKGGGRKERKQKESESTRKETTKRADVWAKFRLESERDMR